MKKLLILLFSILLFMSNHREIKASDYMVGESANLKSNFQEKEFDYRKIVLKNYLMSHNSPIADYSDQFIMSADKYNLDWRFVPAITGVESTFGKRIPVGSYNAYGWANGNYYFESWDQSIEHVSRVLKEKYIDDGLDTVDKIAYRYAPPSSSWGWKVKYFMDKIDSVPLEFTL